jgi:hypothetical protein
MVNEATTDQTTNSDQTILDEAGKKPDASDRSASDQAVKPEVKLDANGKPIADAAKPADEKPTDKPQGAPEKYEPFKVPEGVVLDEKRTQAVQALFKELNLTQDAGQKLVDFQSAALKADRESYEANFKAMQKDWAEETRKGLGAEADKQLGYAAAFRDKFLTEGAREILKQSGLGNHPEIIKSFIQAGKAISEDGFVPGRAALDEKKSPAATMYPDMK